MSDSLPERPDLEQLRRQAKELRGAARRGDPAALQRFARHHPTPVAGEFALAAAQLVVARELGFTSWPRLRAAVDAAAATTAGVAAFLAASVEGRSDQATDLLLADPAIATRSLLAASVLGDAGAVRSAVGADPGASVAIDDERGWPPLLYLCYSRWHLIDPRRGPAMAEAARILLDAGANPNTNDGGRPRYRSALKGAVEVNNPDVVEVLLDAGANPDPGQPIGEAVGHRDLRCLRLLLAHGARVARTWAVGAAVSVDDPAALSLLLGSLEAPASASGPAAAETASEALPDAAAGASLRVVAMLLDAGADPNTADDDGVSAFRHAVRAGKNEIAARLRSRGATDDATGVDRFIGACRNGDRQAVQDILAGDGDVRARLSDADRAVIVDAAGCGPAETVQVLLDMGFSPHARDDLGETPLHSAAYHGNAAVVRLLLEAGAEVDARDHHFHATPLAFATVGSGEHARESGAWTETVRLLVDAGAARRDVWVADKPPSDEVIAVLRELGVSPSGDDQTAERAADLASDVPLPAERALDLASDLRLPAERALDLATDDPVPAIGTGVMADIALVLDHACRELDLDAFESVLHPDVHWTGLCRNRAQVLDWYRMIVASGTRPTVDSVEVDGDAVVVGMTLTGRAEGARPAPPQRRYQVFVVRDAQIVDILGYPDRAGAFARAQSGA